MTFIINPYAFSTGGGGEVPDLIADIWEWWEPSRETGLVNNDPMPTLTGLKNGRDWTQGTPGDEPLFETAGLNGLAVANFGTDNGWTGPNMSALTEAHVLILVKIQSDPSGTGHGGLWSMGSGDTAGVPSVYPFTDGVIYECALSTARKTLGNPGKRLNHWRIYEIVSTSSEYTAFINRTQLFTTATNTVGLRSAPLLGVNENSDDCQNGRLAGMYLANAKIGSTDLDDLYDYIITRFDLLAETSFVITPTTTTLRSNFTGEVGIKVTMGDTITLNELGRWRVSGNSGTHTLRVRDSSETQIASVSYDASAGTVGAFNYVALGTPITLTAGQQYFITSQELNGGDQWYDTGAVTYNAVASTVNNTFSATGSGFSVGAANQMYVPIDFKYELQIP